ncbi:hypothetical protein QBC34DRAFT_385910 [Podospora aff. communis PSN243]|uniref:Cyanovirin-N domain-containing protein n=1 Tax=Podospora aff. communis PSN243 TaxID=3040156 RepID=A0AAV9G6T4_9PEZI|nr:hypothetical protein QBC34DRAFT_385910 [Podospora aff. communis PSN243]
MHCATIILALAASVALALPSNHEFKRADELADKPTYVPMQWVGRLSPDSDETTTLYGTAPSILEQILQLKPDYSPWDFEDYRTDMQAKGITREMDDAGLEHVARRRAVSLNPSAVLKREEGWFDCNAGTGLVDWGSCEEGLGTMRRLGGGSALCAVDGRGVPYTCTRFSCSWNCGIFLCSRFGAMVQVLCRDIATDMEKIAGACNRSGWVKGRLVFNTHYTELNRQDC